MKRVALVLVALSLAATAAGCGASKHVSFSRGVIHVGVGVDDRTLTKSILGLGVGTPQSRVRTRLGDPFLRAAEGRQSCWSYRADQGGSSQSEYAASALDGIVFCMSPSHRVARIELAVHA
jgi:outer membrane protein assembly factor BamE (lipoprotein component of BamABCDE complex)